jgi:hypothetical protein
MKDDGTQEEKLTSEPIATLPGFLPMSGSRWSIAHSKGKKTRLRLRQFRSQAVLGFLLLELV